MYRRLQRMQIRGGGFQESPLGRHCKVRRGGTTLRTESLDMIVIWRAMIVITIPILLSTSGSISSAACVLSSMNYLERRERVVELPGQDWNTSVPPACIRL